MKILKHAILSIALLAVASAAFGQNDDQSGKVKIDDIPDLTGGGTTTPPSNQPPIGNGFTIPLLSQTEPGPSGPSGSVGSPGPKGQRGARGPAGKPGVTTTKIIKVERPERGHKDLFQSIFGVNGAFGPFGLVSQSYVHQYVSKQIEENNKKLNKPGNGIGRSAGSNPGGKSMWDPFIVLCWVVGLLLVFSIGHWLWGNYVNPKGLDNRNNAAERAAYNSEKEQKATFRERVTKSSYELESTPSDVAIAQAEAQARIAEAKAEAAGYEAAARAARREGIFQMITGAQQSALILAPGGGGWVPDVPSGQTGSPGPATQRTYSVEELTALSGVLGGKKETPPRPAAKATETAKT